MDTDDCGSHKHRKGKQFSGGPSQISMGGGEFVRSIKGSLINAEVTELEGPTS
jgi:hypothetical protein